MKKRESLIVPWIFVAIGVVFVLMSLLTGAVIIW